MSPNKAAKVLVRRLHFLSSRIEKTGRFFSDGHKDVIEAHALCVALEALSEKHELTPEVNKSISMAALTFNEVRMKGKELAA